MASISQWNIVYKCDTIFVAKRQNCIILNIYFEFVHFEPIAKHLFFLIIFQTSFCI